MARMKFAAVASDLAVMVRPSPDDAGGSPRPPPTVGQARLVWDGRDASSSRRKLSAGPIPLNEPNQKLISLP
jgi:hypothetical protein